MSDGASGTFALVESLLDQIQPGENPYAGFIRVLRSQFYGSQPHALVVQIHAFQGLYSLMAMVIIAALIVRVVRGNFWMYRLIPTSRGSFIMPHSAINFMIYNAIYMVFFNGLAAAWFRFTSPGNGNLRSYIEWQSLPFLALNTAGLHLAMGIAITAIITPKGDVSGRPALPASVVNTYFLANLFLLPILVIPTTVVAGKYFDRTFDDFLAIAAALEPSVESWRGEAIDLAVLMALLPLGEDLVTSMDSFLKWFRIAFVMWSFFGVLVAITIVLAAFFHIHSLRTQLARLNSVAAVPPPENVRASLSLSNTARKPDAKIDNKRRELSRDIIVTWATMIGVCAMVIILVGTLLWSAIGGPKIITKSSDNQVMSYATNYTYTSLGCTSLVVLCYRSFTQEGSTLRKTASSSLGSKSTGAGRASRSHLRVTPDSNSRALGSLAIHVDLEQTVEIELGEYDSAPGEKSECR